MPARRTKRRFKTMLLRKKVRTLVDQGLLSLGYPTAQLNQSDTTVVLFYHGIGDEGVSPHDFEKQLHYLKTHFDLIFSSEVGKPTSSGRLRVAITFDDGLKNTKNVALPILQKLDAKATVFVLPCEIPWLWPAETRKRLASGLSAGLQLEGLDLDDEDDIDRIVEDLKSMSSDAFQDTLEQIHARTSFEPSEDWLAANELMTADELRALPEDLIELGAHTIHHPILPQLDQKTLQDEIVGSKERLEALLERPIRTFSYPNGNFDQRCLRLAEQHFDFAFTTESAIDQYLEPAKIKNHHHAINRLHGVDCHADMPFNIYRFIKQGYGFASVDEPKTADCHVAVVSTPS